MAVATVTSKGQITIPVEVRRMLGLRPGSRVDFVRLADGSWVMAASNRSVTVLKGLVTAPAAPVTIEAMDEAVGAEVAERHAR